MHARTNARDIHVDKVAMRIATCVASLYVKFEPGGGHDGALGCLLQATLGGKQGVEIGMLG